MIKSKATREDIRIWHYLNKLKEESECLDKQVACVIVGRTSGEILSSGVNTIKVCNFQCDDKENRLCDVTHAEEVAANNFSRYNTPDARGEKIVAYVNLFPCTTCQQILSPFVSEIVAFGFVHKEPVFENIRVVPDLSADLIEHNGRDGQLSIVQGELAELITGISDYFYRPDKLMPLEEILDEVVDVELMLENLKRLIWADNKNSYNVLRDLRGEKLVRLPDRIL